MRARPRRRVRRARATRTREELVAAGARPRRERLSGGEALTASERRVAQMAATGMTNREIAQALFVTMKAVALHLTHAYEKLDIAGRAQLSHALGAENRPGVAEGAERDGSCARRRGNTGKGRVTRQTTAGLMPASPASGGIGSPVTHRSARPIAAFAPAHVRR
ncbi:MAG: helix-turn-helix transcriptional regulator [Solirubrobacterales bacterium]|nr:helix-turn-helix transcriptional regulator [Solirubrobacterales bacterium]